MDIKMGPRELEGFLAEAFPQVQNLFHVEDVAPLRIRVRMPIGDRHLRPGGTVSGPSIFSLADVTIYLAVLSMIGPQALAVTTSCNIDFMRKPAGGKDLISEGRLLKLGRSLAVGDVLIHSDGVDEPAARASLTYSIPPDRQSS